MGRKNKSNNITLNMDKKTKTSVALNMDDMDETARNAMQVEMDPNAIPNLEKLLENIQNLLEDIESEPMQKLAKVNKKEFEKIITHKYFQGQDVPLKIVNLMLEEERYENLEKLLDMLDRLKDVQQGKLEINNAYKQFSEKLNETYVYPVHGGKEKFEKKMAETATKKE